MNPVQFPQANDSFGAPSGMEEEVAALPVFKGIINGMPGNMSAWKPSPEELEALNNGGLVYLTIYGVGHPVVSISGTEPTFK